MREIRGGRAQFMRLADSLPSTERVGLVSCVNSLSLGPGVGVSSKPVTLQTNGSQE